MNIYINTDNDLFLQRETQTNKSRIYNKKPEEIKLKTGYNKITLAKLSTKPKNSVIIQTCMATTKIEEIEKVYYN